jgi:Lon protease-like protein
VVYEDDLCPKLERRQVSKRPFIVPFESLPNTLPIFPLSGAILMPNAELPLNIFEPRYINMIEDALGGQRLIGMIQPDQDRGRRQCLSLRLRGPHHPVS